MIKAIIFDCFGVLVGTGFQGAYAAAGGDPVRDADFIHEILYKANAGLIPDQEFSQLVASKIGIPVDEYRTIVNQEERPNRQLFDYIDKNLKSRFKLAILSNANTGVIERKIPENLLDVFDAKFISAEVGLQKPDPAIFDLATQSLGVNHDEAIFIDDLEQYIEPAKALGLKTIHYTDFPSFKQHIDQLIDSN